MRKRAESIVLCVSLAACVGCAEGREGEPDPHPILVAHEELRIGSVDDPETSLTRISALEITSDGRIYTLHRREHRVRIHAPDGTPLGAFGSEGEGPGEFRSVLSMDLLDGEVAVFDSRTLRASYFDLDGVFLRAETFRPRAKQDPHIGTTRPAGILRAGTFFGEVPRGTIRGSEEITAAPILRLALDGSTLDTLAMRSLENRDLILELGSEPTFTGQLFADDPLFALSPLRMELVMVDRRIRPGVPVFGVAKLGIGGDTLWSREYAFEPMSYDASVVDSFVLSLSERLTRIGFAASERQAETEIRNRLYTPAHLPAVTRVRIGHDGSVWMALNDRDPVSRHWLVLRTDGEVLGELALPETFGVLYATEAVVWGAELDELDIPYIVKFSVSQAP